MRDFLARLQMRKFIMFMRAFWFMWLVRGRIDVSDWVCRLRVVMI